MQFWKEEPQAFYPQYSDVLHLRGVEEEHPCVLGMYTDRDTGNIIFAEQCDGYYSVEMTPEQAKAALLEAIAWVEAHGPRRLHR